MLRVLHSKLYRVHYIREGPTVYKGLQEVRVDAPEEPSDQRNLISIELNEFLNKLLFSGSMRSRRHTSPPIHTRAFQERAGEYKECRLCFFSLEGTSGFHVPDWNTFQLRGIRYRAEILDLT